MSYTLKPHVKKFLWRWLAITLFSALAVCVLAYLVDYAVFRYRVASNRNAYGQVTVNSYDAVGEKNGKTEFIFNPPENQSCAHALFPQGGYPPCWYLKSHSEPRTNI